MYHVGLYLHTGSSLARESARVDGLRWALFCRLALELFNYISNC